MFLSPKSPAICFLGILWAIVPHHGLRMEICCSCRKGETFPRSSDDWRSGIKGLKLSNETRCLSITIRFSISLLRHLLMLPNDARVLQWSLALQLV